MKNLLLSLVVLVMLSGCIEGNLPEPMNLPYTEILQTCMDRVSIGGTLQVVVNSQATYDSLFYARFQKPLDDYWNANYDSTLYSMKQAYPGLSDSEYAVLVRSAFYSSYPFMGTDTCSQPAIDFRNRTLLGQATFGSGCTQPDYQISLLRDDAGREVIFRIKVIQHGYCEIEIDRNIWLLVSKIPESYKVVFQTEYTHQ